MGGTRASSGKSNKSRGQPQGYQYDDSPGNFNQVQNIGGSGKKQRGSSGKGQKAQQVLFQNEDVDD